MTLSRYSLRLPVCLIAAALLISAQTRRPLNHRDYDGWRAIVGQRLSADGKFLGYGVFPQEGDGEIVIRNLVTGKEQREPAGARPQPTAAAVPEEGPAPEARGVTIAFSADSRTLVFSTFPAKADSEKAKKDKKPAPKDAMVIVDLASGKSTRIERVKRFAMPEKASGILAYLKEGPDAPAAAAARVPSSAATWCSGTWPTAPSAPSVTSRSSLSPMTARTCSTQSLHATPRRTASSLPRWVPPTRPRRCSQAKASTSN